MSSGSRVRFPTRATVLSELAIGPFIELWLYGGVIHPEGTIGEPLRAFHGPVVGKNQVAVEGGSCVSGDAGLVLLARPVGEEH